MRVDLPGHIDADHFLAVLRVAQHLLCRNTTGLENFLIVIDVVQEGIQGLDPLPQARFHNAPLMRRNNARHDVERDQALLAGLFAIHGKGNADAVKGEIGFLTLARNHIRRSGIQPITKALVTRSHGTGGVKHFVVGLHISNRGNNT